MFLRLMLMKRKLVVLLALGTSVAVARPDPCHTSISALRIACLRSNKVNLHVGPGLNYPVDWVLTVRHMPVQVLAESGPWRRIQLIDGTRGWVHKSTLCIRKTAQLRQTAFLYTSPSDRARKIARVGSLAVVTLVKRKGVWLKVQATTPDGDMTVGWLEENKLWGLREP